ncbi:hypothetical protein BRADI_1g11423v3 [Brachypodium distachyon]|uniref:Uncharacterized protein n=1 Tax=Brachypodium distachyon TaxID=15368 RepID=A0A2K2DJ07_BRADI|nr:hypothetical protein BRADI_1g11423v3 [Brachypodium distachyon]PNT74258.1 hypothetical protein BRADI_1g11423v3 [Brachypodium distachyon]
MAGYIGCVASFANRSEGAGDILFSFAWCVGFAALVHAAVCSLAFRGPPLMIGLSFLSHLPHSSLDAITSSGEVSRFCGWNWTA